MVDFGLSCPLDGLAKADAFAGTPEYIPPEAFDKWKPGIYSDWWSFGCILFEMVAGFPPFFSQQDSFEHTKNRVCNEPPPLYFLNNPVLRDLIGKLLQKDPRSRLGTQGVKEIKNHSWFYGVSWEALLK